MKALLADTLFKRLFALMWLALVISNAVAFFAIALNVPMIAAGPLPIFPSLPPVPFAHHPGAPPAGASALHGGFGEPGGPPAPRNQPGAMGWPPPPPMPTQPAGARRDGRGDSSHEFGLSTTMTLLDYGIRLLIIGLAAWLGARWLSAPMRRLQSASRTLGQSLERGELPPVLDECGGTVEVRETAHVFNEMSRQLSEQVNSRALLVAAISHDLRTPLTRIRMRLEGSEDDPLTARSIADIHEMDDLIESALEVFRGSGAHEEASEVTDVHALVQALVDDLADLGQPVSVQGGPAPARVQTAGLRRAVSNLVNNALRYGKRADVGVRAVGDEVRILIEDEGPGIAPEQLEAVMKPFYRLEASRNRQTGGSGLGLYIARDLVARQGGTLALENRAEGGLRATIALKLA